jgi:AAA family ATP:ADP antiporter
MICSFLITMEASITKAVSNSVFIALYSAKWLPYAWLALVPLNLLIVSGYNRFLPKIGCFKMLLATTLFTICVNVFSAYYLSQIKWFPFALYLWKDLYIMLMFQQLWSVLNATVTLSKAKYLYGILYGVGGMGSVLGSMVPGFLAVRYGSEKLLLITIPFYILLIIAYGIMLKIREKHPDMEAISFDSSAKSNFTTGAVQIFRSKLLVFIMLLVIFMQISSTLLDFKFNSAIEILYPIKDLRTEYLGKFFSLVNGANVILQFLGSFIFIHLLGLKRSHTVIPLFMMVCTSLMFAMPIFPILAFTYGAIKTIDYSIFGVIKEMLYIPLSMEEKFKAKSVIDIFAYRSSKALASLLVIALEFFFVSSIDRVVTLLLIFIFSLWVFAVIALYAKEERSSAML